MQPMDFEFVNLRELSPNTVAAVMGAAVTLMAALINLRIAWRREVLSRLQGPRGGKPRRGLLPAIAFLVGAAAVGGYALALYLMQMHDSESALLRTELRERAQQIQSSAERIEGARVQERLVTLSEARSNEERRRGAEGASAATRLAPCRARADAACREEDAVHAAVCAVLPAKAVAVEIGAYAGLTVADGPGAYAPVALGADLGTARIAPKPIERSDGGDKLLCLEAWSWDGQRALDLRIVVKYLLGEVAAPSSAAASAPLAEARTTSITPLATRTDSPPLPGML